MAKTAKKTNKPKQATKSKSIANKGTVKRKSAAKRAVQDNAKKKITRMGLKRWNSMSKEHQEEYLKEHPNSQYHKIGIKHEEAGSHPEKPAEHTEAPGNSSPAPDTATTPENPETASGTPETKSDAPDTNVDAPEPKKPFISRFRDAIGNLKQTLKESAHEGFHEGLNQSLDKAIEKPLTHEESKARQEEYTRNPPERPKDSHDVMAMVVGLAAIAAIGALATVAPGAAILVGLQVLDHSPDLMRAIGERQTARNEKQDKEWDDYNQKRKDFEDEDEEYRRRAHKSGRKAKEDDDETADIVGDTVEQHINNLDANDKDYFKKRIADLDDAGSEAHERLKKKWAGDPNWKQRGTETQDQNAETDSTPPPAAENTDENTEGGETDNEEDENDDEDDKDDKDDEDEDEPEPEPVKKRRRRVQAALLNTVEASFSGIDIRSDLERKIAVVAEQYDSTKGIRQATLSDKGSGTYAALKLHPSSARLLNKWAKDQGIDKPFDPSYMHITTCYSKRAVDYRPLSFVHGGREVHPKALEFLGRDEGASNNEKTLVLLLEPGFPNRRFNYARAQGASHDFPDYKPHVSIAPPGHGLDSLDSLDLSQINFPLIVDYEYSDVLSRTIPEQGVAVSRPNPVIAKRFTRSGSLRNRDGKVLHYKQGDVKLTDRSGDTWPIKASIFKERYRRLDDGHFDKKSKNTVYYRIHTDKIETVKTLEGDQTVNPGDYILSHEQHGESWPVSKDTFERLYSIIVDKN